MINKIIHLCWLGTADLPDYALAHINAWIALNPHHEVICWFSEESIGKALASAFSETEITSINVLSQSHFKNYDLLQKFLEGDNPLAASDVLKVELMVHWGGYYFDLGIKPSSSLEQLVPQDAQALCDITTLGKIGMTGTKLTITNRSNGEYHFHASIKEGELYTKAQALQTALFKEIRKDRDLFNVFFSQNKELKYQATKNGTGLTVFLAIDCLLIQHENNMPFLTVFSVSNLGTPRQRMGQRQGLGFMESLNLYSFCQKALALNQSFLHKEAAKSPYAQKYAQGLGIFPKPKPHAHESLLQEMKMVSKVPLEINEAIEQKKYALALRRACSGGYCAIIAVLDRYHESLAINYDERSSNGKSAWDWLEASSATAENKERFRLVLSGSESQDTACFSKKVT